MYAPLDLAVDETDTSVLLAGDDREAVRELFHDALAPTDEGQQSTASPSVAIRDETGTPPDAALVLVAEDAAAAVASLTERGRDADAIGVIDATGECAVTRGVAEAGCVEGPGSLSALGVQASDRLGRLDGRYEHVAVGLDSVTTLLDAQGLPAVFRFLHVLVGRVGTSDAVLVATLERTVHGPETVGTVAELFDVVVDVPTDGVPEVV